LIVRGITFERAQLVRLDAVAARERRSRSYLVRDAVDEALARYERRHGADRGEAR
jgi:metal-responsive CopG/Arc/MetJ family transcriptional regulator